MSEEILVRGSESVWGRILGRGAAALLVVAGATLYFGFNLSLVGAIVAAAGVALWLATDICGLRNNRRKRWVTDTGDGFTVADRAGQRDYRDEQVAGITLANTEKYSSGILKSVRHRVQLWIDEETAPTELDYVVRVGDSDPLAPLVNRWLESIKSRASAAMAQGGELVGDGWSLRSNVLAVTSGPTTGEIGFDDVVQMGVFGGQVCLWRRGDEEASLKLNPEGRNMPVLMQILGELLEGKEESPVAEEASAPQMGPLSESQGTGLGRVLFERRWRTARLVAAVAAAILGGLGVYVILSLDAPPIAIGLFVLAAILVLAAVRVPASVFRCHARGVFQSGLFGKRQMRYDEVETFTYKATRMFVEGSYTGTMFALKFSSPVTTISYNKKVKNIDEDLENLRDHIAGVIAGRMGEKFSAGESVEWTRFLTLRPDGIEFVPQGFLGRKERQFLPYGDIAGFEVKEGVFHLFAAGQSKSVMREQTSQTNFYPGFFLLSSMFEQPDSA
jgi:hypothetical protein